MRSAYRATSVIFLFTLASSAFAQTTTQVEAETIESTCRFQNDGTGQITVRAKWKALTAAGVKTITQFSIPYASEYEDIQVAYFRTLKKGGTLQGDPKQVFDTTPPQEPNAPVFSGTKLKQFVLPNVEEGDTVEYEYAKTTRPQKPKEFWAIHIPTRNFVVRSESVTLDFPADRKVAFHFDATLPHTTEKTNGRDVERWTFSNKEAEALNEVNSRPTFAVSTILSWSLLGQWLKSLNDASTAVTPEIQSLALKLTSGKSDDRRKIDTLYQFVSTNIRYVSISFGLGRFQPHPAAEVLKNAYGDCKDKNALLTALLRAAGIHAQAVLTSPGLGVIEPEVPFPTQFTHEFTAVDFAIAPIYLDTTLEFAEPELLMPGTRGKKALLIREAKSEVIDVPGRSQVPERLLTKLSGTISKSGKFDGANSVECTGFTALVYRRTFRDGTEEQKQAMLKEASGLELRAGTITKVTSSDPKDLLHPFSVRYRIEQEEFAPVTETSKRFTLLTSNLIDLRPLAKMKKPRSPIAMSSEDATRTIDLIVDPIFTIDTPMPVHVKANFGDYNSEFRYDAGHLYLNRTAQFGGTSVQPQDWDKLVSLLTSMELDEARGFSLERKPSPDGRLSANFADLTRDGVQALNRRDFAAAQKSFTEVTRLSPNDQRAWNDLGLAYLGLHKADKAEDAFKRQIALNPTSQYAYNNLGRIYLQRHEPDLAIVQFKKQLEINPRDQFSHGNLARALELKADWKRAEQESLTATEIWPANPHGWIYLGRAQAKLGNAEDARKSFDRALQASDDTAIQNDVAYELAEAGIDLDKAWQLASSAITIGSSEVCDPEKLVVDAGCSERLGRLSASLDTAGWILTKQGKPEAALPYISSAYAISPRPASALHLALLNAKRGKLDDAFKLYAAARLAKGFQEADDSLVQDDLTKQAGGKSAFEERVRLISKNSGSLGLVCSIPIAKTTESFPDLETVALQVLVAPDGRITELRQSSKNQLATAMIDQIKGLKLLPTSWPGHELRSVRSIRLHASEDLVHIIAYVIPPASEGTSD